MKHLDTIIHLGAGSCRELAKHLECQPDRIILVEPDPVRVAVVRRQTRHESSVEVRQLAITSKSGVAQLRRYNFADLNSLRRPTGICTLFPGLRQVQMVDVACSTIGELLAQLELKSSVANRLIIDTPGEEHVILRGLIDADQLHLFDSLILNCSRQPAYFEAEPAQYLLRDLDDQGYQLLDCDTTIDPERPCWTFQRDDARIENKWLREQALAQNLEIEAAKAQAAEQAKLAEQRTKEIDAAKAQAAEQAKLAEQRTAKAQIAEQQEIEAAKAQAAEQAKLAEQRSKEIEAAKAQAAEQAKLAEQRSNELNEREQTYAALQHDYAMAQRRRGLIESDFNDLQARYATVLEQKDRQTALLKTLKERLGAASKHLEAVDHDGVNGIIDNATQAISSDDVTPDDTPSARGAAEAAAAPRMHSDAEPSG